MDLKGLKEKKGDQRAMTIQKCDRCREEIKDNGKQYWLQIEEHDYVSDWYTPPIQNRAQICVNCYKQIWGEIVQ